MTKRMGVEAVFLVGCAVGGASSQLVVPRASAQQGTLTRWENICIEDGEWAAVGPSATKAGSQGWEMVGIDSGVACFKLK